MVFEDTNLRLESGWTVPLRTGVVVNDTMQVLASAHGAFSYSSSMTSFRNGNGRKMVFGTYKVI